VRILMFGRGVIASVYGWALGTAGHSVEHYVRPGRATRGTEAIDLDLIDLRHPPLGRRVAQKWPVTLREEFSPDDGFDLVVLSVSHHRLAEAADVIAPRLGSASVLVFGNAWPDPAAAVASLPADQVVWGFPGGGGGFQESGVLRGCLLPSVRLGASGETVARMSAIRGAFRDAGIRVRVDSDILGWLAVHFVADAGIHAQGLRHGTLSQLAGSTPALREALLTSGELLPLLEAKGVDLRRHRGATAGFRHPAVAAPAMGWLTRHVAPARISLESHTDPHAAEPRAVVRDALAEARRYGISAPRLAQVESLLDAGGSPGSPVDERDSHAE
jgi:2-dehydropantoate 2-reductase